ncbi:hypothetical protein CSUI_006080 [Cystoisospora suis]|uniref:Uncharacterized protein n=1 Tax=Cystoisospora suis TaxID=483139 RepID=A0A2C6K2J6_9APIC|nr:hypothetical protein CSUI_006080 [Cystoisospora suis]
MEKQKGTCSDAMSASEQSQEGADVWGCVRCPQREGKDVQDVRPDDQTVRSSSCRADNRSFWSDFLSISIPPEVCEGAGSQRMEGSSAHAEPRAEPLKASNTRDSSSQCPKEEMESYSPRARSQPELFEHWSDDSIHRTGHQHDSIEKPRQANFGRFSSVQNCLEESRGDTFASESASRLNDASGIISKKSSWSGVGEFGSEMEEPMVPESSGSSWYSALQLHEVGGESDRELSTSLERQCSATQCLEKDDCSAYEVTNSLRPEQGSQGVYADSKERPTALMSVPLSGEWQRSVSPEPLQGLGVSGRASKKGSRQRVAQPNHSRGTPLKAGASAGVPGSHRFVPALGAAGRQLVLDRIRSRYHTDVVYYSGLLRDKYNSTISKLPFFTVSRLHQLAADFGIDTQAVLNGQSEAVNAGGRGGSGCRRGRPHRHTVNSTQRSGLGGRKESTHGCTGSPTPKSQIHAGRKSLRAQSRPRLSKSSRRGATGATVEGETGRRAGEDVAAPVEVPPLLNSVSQLPQHISPCFAGRESFFWGKGSGPSSIDSPTSAVGGGSCVTADEGNSCCADAHVSEIPPASSEEEWSTAWSKESTGVCVGTGGESTDLSRGGSHEKRVTMDRHRVEKWAQSGGASSETSLPTSGAPTVGGDVDEATSPRVACRSPTPEGTNWHAAIDLQNPEITMEHLDSGSGQCSFAQSSRGRGRSQETDAAEMSSSCGPEEPSNRRCELNGIESETFTPICGTSGTVSVIVDRDKKRPAQLVSCGAATVDCIEKRPDQGRHPQLNNEGASLGGRCTAALEDFCGRVTRRKVLQTTWSESTTFTSSPTTPTAGVSAETQSLSPTSPLAGVGTNVLCAEPRGGQNCTVDVREQPESQADYSLAQETATVRSELGATGASDLEGTCEEAKLFMLLKQLVPEKSATGPPFSLASPPSPCSMVLGREARLQTADAHATVTGKQRLMAQESHATNTSSGPSEGVDRGLSEVVSSIHKLDIHSGVASQSFSRWPSAERMPDATDLVVSVEHIREFLETQRYRKTTADGTTVGGERECSRGRDGELRRFSAAGYGHEEGKPDTSAHGLPDNESVDSSFKSATSEQAEILPGSLRRAGVQASPFHKVLRQCLGEPEKDDSSSVSCNGFRPGETSYGSPAFSCHVGKGLDRTVHTIVNYNDAADSETKQPVKQPGERFQPWPAGACLGTAGYGESAADHLDHLAEEMLRGTVRQDGHGREGGDAILLLGALLSWAKGATQQDVAEWRQSLELVADMLSSAETCDRPAQARRAVEIQAQVDIAGSS